ncbi:MAG: DUF6838 family protein [Oscillospiraceae bacterium]
MTANNTILAVAEKLTDLWPDRKVRVDEIPKDADGVFFVQVLTPSQNRELGDRHRRASTISVIYFTKDHENMVYNDWAETMMLHFVDIAIGGTLYQTKRPHAEQVGREYHFLFDLDIGVMIKDPSAENMEGMAYEGSLKDG